MAVKRIRADVVNRLQPGERVSDDKLPGFRVRRQTTTTRVYEFNYYINGVRKQVKIGRHGTVTPDGMTSWTPEPRDGRPNGWRVSSRKASIRKPSGEARARPASKICSTGSWPSTSNGYGKRTPRARTNGLIRNTYPRRWGTARWQILRGPISKSCRANCFASRLRQTCAWPSCRRCLKSRRRGGGVHNTQTLVGMSNGTKPTAGNAS